MELSYLDGLRIARDLAKDNEIETLNLLIASIEKQQIETTSIVLDLETR